MKSTNLKIFETLVVDTTLLVMLAKNTLLDGSGTLSTANSIVPSDLVTKKLETPFITIQEGNENINGHIMTQTFYLRCYNDDSKSYIEINTILDRVRELLDNAELSLTDRRFVKVTTESRLPGLRDEEMGLKFKEERYRVTVL